MTIEKWQKFEARFADDMAIAVSLEARQGSKQYIALPIPFGATFKPGELSAWGFATGEQLAAVTHAPTDVRITARDLMGGIVATLATRFSHEMTSVEKLRETVRNMEPGDRHLMAHAIAHEEGIRAADDAADKAPAWFAWNRVKAAIEEALEFEEDDDASE